MSLPESLARAKRYTIHQPILGLDNEYKVRAPIRTLARAPYKDPSFAVPLNCGIGSRSLNADVEAFDKLYIVRARKSSCAAQSTISAHAVPNYTEIPPLGDERSQFQALRFNLFADLGRQAILKVVDGIKRCHGVLPTGFMVPEIANL